MKARTIAGSSRQANSYSHMAVPVLMPQNLENKATIVLQSLAAEPNQNLGIRFVFAV